MLHMILGKHANLTHLPVSLYIFHSGVLCESSVSHLESFLQFGLSLEMCHFYASVYLLYVEFSPLNLYWSSSECDLIWREGLYRWNQTKTMLLESALIQYDWCPYKSRTLDIDIYGERMPCGEECKDRDDAFTCQGLSMIANRPPEGRIGAWNKFSSQSLRRSQLCQHLILDF